MPYEWLSEIMDMNYFGEEDAPAVLVRAAPPTDLVDITTGKDNILCLSYGRTDRTNLGAVF